jgi:hypothetical protein
MRILLIDCRQTRASQLLLVLLPVVCRMLVSRGKAWSQHNMLEVS